MTTMLTPESPEDLLSKVVQLNQADFERFVEELLAVQAHRRSDTFSGIEAELLKKINLGISPDVWPRYEKLKAKKRSLTLTPAEQDELISIGDQIEEANARRMKALVELASLRRRNLGGLMKEFGIAPPPIDPLPGTDSLSE